MLLPPVELFRLCANAAHEAHAAPTSAYVAYHDITRTDVTRRSQTFGVKVTIDNASGNVIVRADSAPRSFVSRVAQPVPANFNALSDFVFAFQVDDDAKLRYAYASRARPLTYTQAAEGDRRSDVVVYSLKGYIVEYAEDTRVEGLPQYHLKLRPIDDEHRRVIHFTDVYVDAATHLPAKVVFEGDDPTQMIFEYAHTTGTLVLERFFYTRRIYGPAHIVRSTVAIDTTFDHVVFTDHDPYSDATGAATTPAQRQVDDAGTPQRGGPRRDPVRRRARTAAALASVGIADFGPDATITMTMTMTKATPRRRHPMRLCH